MKNKFLLFISFIMFTGCTQPSPEMIQTAIVETEHAVHQTEQAKSTTTPSNTATPTITLTPTNIPPSMVIIDDLESVLYQIGDFPEGYKPLKVTNENKHFSYNNNLAKNWFSLDIDCYSPYSDKPGGLTIGINDTVDEAKNLQIALVDQFIISDKKMAEFNQNENNEGVTGTYETSDGTLINYSVFRLDNSDFGIPNVDLFSVVFQKCYFAGVITLFYSDNYDGLIDYAERLSQRLSDVYNCDD